MAITQKSRIKIRSGLYSDLPQLATGEMGWAIDTKRLFIGNGTIEEGASSLGHTEILTIYSNLSGIATMSGDLAITGKLSIGGSISTNRISTSIKTITSFYSGSYVVTDTDSSLIINFSGTQSLTLPSASANIGRMITIKTVTANTVVSNSANVVQLTGGSPTAAILPATNGKWVILHSDGINWHIMSSN